MRIPAAPALALLLALPSVAMAMTADDAAKTIAAVASDAERLKTFCAMARILNTDSDERPAGAAEAEDKKLESLFAVLGPEFRAAWDFGVGAEPDSADAKTVDAAIASLEAKCDK